MNVLFVGQNNKGWMYETLYHEQRALEKELILNNHKVFKFGPGFKFCKDLNFNFFCKKNNLFQKDIDLILFYISHYTFQTGEIDNTSKENFMCSTNKILHNFSHIKNIPKILWLNDFWQLNKFERIYYENKYKISHILSTYYYHLDKKTKNKFFMKYKYPENRILHINRSLNKNNLINQKVNNLRKIDVTLLGAINDFYPERKKFFNLIKNEKKINFFFKKHPGYNFQKKIKKNLVFGKKYFQILNNSKIFVTCGTKLNLPVIKLYEIISSGCLLMTGKINNLSKVGLKDKHNFVQVTEKDLISKINYYLNNKKEREKITKNAKILFKKKYLNYIQAKKQYQIIIKIKKNYKNKKVLNSFENIYIFMILQFLNFLKRVKKIIA